MKLSDGTEKDVTIIDSFEGVGACLAGRMSEADLKRIECAFAPGEGACGGMYTANTMASVAEALGLSLPGSAAPPAADRRRDYFAHRSGEAVVNLLRSGITTRDILTKEAFENAIALAMALGGSTNVVLHLLAIAREAEVELTLHDFNRIGDKVPHIADMKPFGKYVMNDVDRHGGIPVIMKAMLDEGLLHGDALTVTGKTLAENLADLEPRPGRRQRHPHVRQPDPRDRRHHDPARLDRARGRGREVGRLRRERVRGPRPRVRARARRDGRARGRRDRRGRRRSSSATRVPRAARACARCSRSPPPSRALGSEKMYYS